MATVTRSQPSDLSQGRHGGNASGGSNTAPMNDLPVETVTDTQVGGMAGDSAMGSISLGRPSEDH